MNCTFGVGSFKRGIHIKYSYYIHNKVLIILEEDKLDFPVWYSLEETHEPFCFSYEGAKFYDPSYLSIWKLHVQRKERVCDS